MPALLIVVIWTANTAAFTGSRHVQSLFDLTLEELMEIRIGAELRLDCWTASEEVLAGMDAHDLRVESDDASRLGAGGPHRVGGTHAAGTHGPLTSWDN